MIWALSDCSEMTDLGDLSGSNSSSPKSWMRWEGMRLIGETALSMTLASNACQSQRI